MNVQAIGLHILSSGTWELDSLQDAISPPGDGDISIHESLSRTLPPKRPNDMTE